MLSKIGLSAKIQETGSNSYNSKYSCDVNEAKSMIFACLWWRESHVSHNYRYNSGRTVAGSTLNARDILGQMQISRWNLANYQRFTYFL